MYSYRLRIVPWVIRRHHHGDVLTYWGSPVPWYTGSHVELKTTLRALGYQDGSQYFREPGCLSKKSSYNQDTVKIRKIWTPQQNCWANRKFPKYSDTHKICCDHSKIWTMWLYHRVMSPNNADGMANSVDPDQTAPLGAVWSGSALFAQAYLSKNLRSLRYPKI